MSEHYAEFYINTRSTKSLQHSLTGLMERLLSCGYVVMATPVDGVVKGLFNRERDFHSMLNYSVGADDIELLTNLVAQAEKGEEPRWTQ